MFPAERGGALAEHQNPNVFKRKLDLYHNPCIVPACVWPSWLWIWAEEHTVSGYYSLHDKGFIVESRRVAEPLLWPRGILRARIRGSIQVRLVGNSLPTSRPALSKLLPCGETEFRGVLYMTSLSVRRKTPARLFQITSAKISPVMDVPLEILRD